MDTRKSGPQQPVDIRTLQEDDIAGVTDIVNHYIENTAVNLWTARRTPGEWLHKWTIRREKYPWLVACVDDQLAGVAYASPWNERDAYDWCVDITVYVDHAHLRGGVGRALYSRLLPLLDQRGFRSAIAVISLPNPASIALHESFGFRHAGTLQAAGFKFGSWHDVCLYQRVVGPPGQPPRPLMTRS